MSDNNPMASFMNMFKNFGADLEVPSNQVEQVLDYHRKNLQALQDAAQVTSKGGQEMMMKQREALEETLGSIAGMVQNASVDVSDPAKMAGDPAALASKSFEMTVKHASEMSEIARESGTEAFNILRSRMEESISEMTGGLAGKK